MLNGTKEIEKIPFKPKNGDKYFFAWKPSRNGKITVSEEEWNNHSFDYISYKLNNVFRTKEEAEKYGIPIIEHLIEEYKDD